MLRVPRPSITNIRSVYSSPRMSSSMTIRSWDPSTMTARYIEARTSVRSIPSRRAVFSTSSAKPGEVTAILPVSLRWTLTSRTSGVRRAVGECDDTNPMPGISASVRKIAFDAATCTPASISSPNNAMDPAYPPASVVCRSSLPQFVWMPGRCSLA